MNDEGKDTGVGDADLVRYIDGELDAAATARIHAALAGNATLAARLETLRRRTAGLHTLLARTDPPAGRTDPPADIGRSSSPGSPGGGGPGPWLLRAAAVILVFAGVVSLVPPLRALVLDGWTRLTAADEAPARPAPPPPPELLAVPDTVTAERVEVRFDSFDFELTAWQESGTLRIRVEDVESARVEIVTRTTREAFVRLPNGMRIINTAESVADYEVVLPRRVRLVRVTVNAQLIEEYGTRAERNLDRTFEVAR